MPTAELGSYAHAMELWANGRFGVKRTLPNSAAVRQCAAASDGERFSFEKLDRVTRTTVYGRFATALLAAFRNRSTTAALWSALRSQKRLFLRHAL